MTSKEAQARLLLAQFAAADFLNENAEELLNILAHPQDCTGSELSDLRNEMREVLAEWDKASHAMIFAVHDEVNGKS